MHPLEEDDLQVFNQVPSSYPHASTQGRQPEIRQVEDNSSYMWPLLILSHAFG
jgi:hypothetical protein